MDPGMFLLEEFVQFLDQRVKGFGVFFVLEAGAEPVHSLAFLWGHRSAPQKQTVASYLWRRIYDGRETEVKDWLWLEGVGGVGEFLKQDAHLAEELAARLRVI